MGRPGSRFGIPAPWLRLAPGRAGWPASTPPRTDGTVGRLGRMLGRDGSGRAAAAATSRRTRLAVGAAAERPGMSAALR